MVDLRYLALTLIGVFLALAIGLLLGSTLGTPDRRDRVYEGLQQQFEQLRTQNQEVREENDRVRRQISQRDQSLRELLPVAVRGRLPGSVVGVVVCGGLDERPFWNDFEGALRVAGARIGPLIRVPERLKELDADSRARFGRGGALPRPDQQASDEAAGWCIEALARGDTERLQGLAQRTGIQLSGDLSLPVRRIIVLTTVPDEVRAAAVAAGDIPETRIVDAARAEGLRIVAAEPEAVTPSAVDALRRRSGIPVVDNVDTPGGQLSVVLALTGAEGHFGSKPGSTAPIPPLESP